MTRPAALKTKATCRDCQAEIWWIKTERGKNMPLDTHEDLDAFVESYGVWDEDTAPKFQDLRRELGDAAITSHFKTCEARSS